MCHSGFTIDTGIMRPAMPSSTASPDAPHLQTVARRTLLAGILIMLLKFGVYALTDSAAVLSDALESIINIIAEGMTTLEEVMRVTMGD